MKLYDVPRETRINCKASDGSSWVTFHHIDGSYSLCTTEHGAIVHLKAWAEIERSDDGTFTLMKGRSSL